MDRREAIEILKEYRRYALREAITEALDLAIEALVLQDKYVKALERMIEGAKEINKFLEEAAKKSDEKHQLKHQLSEETSTISEKESLEDDLFNKSFWRMGLHDTNVRPCTMADTSTNEGDAETATATDCISRQQAIEAIECVDWYHVNSKGELVHGSTSDEESWYKAEDVYKAIGSLPPVTPTERTGEWKEVMICTDSGIGPVKDWWYCSLCSNHVSYKANYCSNCGASMRPKGGEEE